jgi:hypothetical protein
MTPFQDMSWTPSKKSPAENEAFTMGRFIVTVKEKDGNRIIRYTVKEIEPPEPQKTEDGTTAGSVE